MLGNGRQVWRGLVLASFCAVFVPMVGAQIVTVSLQDGLNSYAGTRDNSIYSNLPNNSDGGGQSIIVGKTGITASGAVRRGLLSFDLSSLPGSIQILDVTLELNVTNAHTGTNVDLHRLTADWGEGTVDAGGPLAENEGQGAAAASGDVTWASRHHTVSAWTAAGGDFVAGVSGTGNGTAGVFTVRGSGMVADVQAWVNGSQANNGWILIGNESTQQSSVRIASSENSGTRPKLIITYQPLAAVPRSLWRP